MKYRIEKDLPNHICKTCDNLGYWDWYYCELGKHKNKVGKLRKTRLTKCSDYKKREGKNWDACINQECMFWCAECPIYKNAIVTQLVE